MRYTSRRYKQNLSRLYRVARANCLPLPFVINTLRAKSEFKTAQPYKRRTKRAFEDGIDREIVKQRLNSPEVDVNIDEL